MAIYTNAGGGGGLDPDGLTAAADDVLKGKTAGVQGSDEPVTGTLELTGSAGDSQVLSGSTYYNTDAKTKRIGSMTNQGAKTTSLNCSGSYTIPAGYHNGAGKVTANSLASQTGGTAVANHLLNGETAWVNGVKITGTLQVYSLVSFSAAASSATSIRCTWQWPSKGPYNRVVICAKAGGYPNNGWDGVTYDGWGNNYALGGWSSADIGGLIPNTTYYLRAWVGYTTATEGVFSGFLQTICTTPVLQGQQVFTSSGTFTVPAYVYSIDVFCVGGGGTGLPGIISSRWTGNKGGGSGYTATKKNIGVTPGSQYAVTVGTGGTCNISGDSYFLNTPGSSSFGNLLSAGGGTPENGRNENNGGSGGGPGAGDSSSKPAGTGGTDGGDGQWTYSGCAQGTGQGTTTRAFGESWNTLYAGGGGGSGGRYSTGGASGGSGGGGNGGGSGGNGVNATAGTGSGGGASGGRTKGLIQPGAGGSGIVIVRWGY